MEFVAQTLRDHYPKAPEDQADAWNPIEATSSYNYIRASQQDDQLTHVKELVTNLKSTLSTKIDLINESLIDRLQRTNAHFRDATVRIENNIAQL